MLIHDFVKNSPCSYSRYKLILPRFKLLKLTNFHITLCRIVHIMNWKPTILCFLPESYTLKHFILNKKWQSLSTSSNLLPQHLMLNFWFLALCKLIHLFTFLQAVEILCSPGSFENFPACTALNMTLVAHSKLCAFAKLGKLGKWPKLPMNQNSSYSSPGSKTAHIIFLQFVSVLTWFVGPVHGPVWMYSWGPFWIHWMKIYRQFWPGPFWFMGRSGIDPINIDYWLIDWLIDWLTVVCY